jgi:N-acetylmuramoyl-L-alanine amidase
MTRALPLLVVLSCCSAAASAQTKPARTLDLICRDGWNAAPFKREALKRHTIRSLTVHHSGRALLNNRTAPARIRGAQRFHQTGKRAWADIAYHYLIDLAGNVYEGRPDWARGDTGTRYDTTGHFLVCVVGNYETQAVRPPQVAALVDLLAWAATKFKVSPQTIRGHLQLARTSCPGKNLQALVKDGTLRKRVEQRLAAGGVRLRRLCGATARQRVQAIRKPAK